MIPNKLKISAMKRIIAKDHNKCKTKKFRKKT